MSRQVADLLPWDETLSRAQDLNWALRAAALPECKLIFCEKPLSVWRNESSRVRIGTKHSWQQSFEWGQTNRHLLTKRAVGGYYLVTVCREAMRANNYFGCLKAWAEGVRNGRPTLFDVIMSVGIMVIPPGRWETLRAAWYGLQRKLARRGPEHTSA